MYCKCKTGFVFKAIALLTWIDGHVPPASKKIKHDVQQRSTNWAINLYQKVKITCSEQTMHSFLSSSLWFPFIYMICVDLFTADTHPTEKDFRQMIHPSGLLPKFFWWQYFFILHHAPSVWTHWSLRLWWQQLLNLSNQLLLPFCLLQESRIMLFCVSSKHFACIPCLQSVILPSKPLLEP